MKTKDLTHISILIAITFIFTYAIQIKLPFGGSGGLVHAGNIALFTIAILYGKEKGAYAGAFGMALFDVLSAWFIWAPGTFIVRLVCGYTVGYISHMHNKNGENTIYNIISMLFGTLVIIVGYYIYESLFISSFSTALGSILGNITQSVIGLVVTVFVMEVLKNRSELRVDNKLSK